MRQILFRGKRLDTGEWAEGYYGYAPRIDTHWIDTGERSHDVDPDTVGQHTGLKDNMGTDIYEGDILKSVKNCITHEGRQINKVEYKHGAFRVDNNVTLEIITSSFRPVVIGNIHDNPDLIN